MTNSLFDYTFIDNKENNISLDWKKIEKDED
jgi:hypothetical protein